MSTKAYIVLKKGRYVNRSMTRVADHAHDFAKIHGGEVKAVAISTKPYETESDFIGYASMGAGGRVLCETFRLKHKDAVIASISPYSDPTIFTIYVKVRKLLGRAHGNISQTKRKPRR